MGKLMGCFAAPIRIMQGYCFDVWDSGCMYLCVHLNYLCVHLNYPLNLLVPLLTDHVCEGMLIARVLRDKCVTICQIIE